MRHVRLKAALFMGSHCHAPDDVVEVDDRRAADLVRHGLAGHVVEGFLPPDEGREAETPPAEQATDPKPRAERAVRKK